MPQPTMSLFLMVNRQPLNYSDLYVRLWYKGETFFKYLIYNFYGIKNVNLPGYQNKIAKLKIQSTTKDHQFSVKVNHQVRTANQLRHLPRRFPYLDGLFNASHSPVFLKKWRRTFKSDATNFALITLAIQNSTTEEEIKWAKISHSLKQLVNEKNKSNQLNETLDEDLFKLENFSFDQYIGKGCNAAIYSAHLKKPNKKLKDKLAVKMLFNYDVESNAYAILRAMNKECIPFNGSFGAEIDKLLGSKRTKLPPHPNIVKMHGIFVDQIPDLPKAKELFKNALPPRLYFNGYGRNMTLFIVMKRYATNLKEYLKSNFLNQDQSLSLLTQLFSGVEFLNNNLISHRDLKSDNILLDFNLDQNYPLLVITDFGLSSTSLNIPYLTDDVCIWGNRALTPPELITAVPGIFSRLDYSRADLWAVGAMAYEIYNNCNPFYPNKYGQFLNSYSYQESELPRPDNMPIYIEILVKSILSRDPALRPDIEICTTLCNLLMFCNELTLKCIANSHLNEKELMKKINLLLTDTLFFSRKKLNKLQLKLKLMFLMDLNVKNVKEAIKYFEI